MIEYNFGFKSTCTACDKRFSGYSGNLFAWQLSEVKCIQKKKHHLCENEKCKYYWIEDFSDGGCTEFILCKECLNNPKQIAEMLDDFDEL